MPTFAEIQEEIGNMLNIPDSELDPEQQKLMDDYLNELARQESAKIDSFAQFIKIQSDRVDALKKESKRLSEKAKTAENKIASLKNWYTGQMINHGLKKISGELYTLSLRKSESVSVPDDITQLDDIYLRRKETVEADKQVIRESLKDGLPVPGCRLVESFSLQIR